MRERLMDAQIQEEASLTKNETLMTFRQCLSLSEGSGYYNRKIFLLMAAHILFASLFLALPFFLFKRPIYCENKSLDICCDQGDLECVNQICGKYAHNILDHVRNDESLTYLFRIFCGQDSLRVVYKIFPQTLSVIGFLIYGKLADAKGRRVSLKISWRMYVVGIVFFSSAQSHFLKIFGYIIACINCFPSLVIQFILYFEHNATRSKNKQSLILLSCLSIGPLLLSFVGGLIINFSNRIILGILCAFPAFILALSDSKIYESALCLYKYDKQKSFGVLNAIAKQNKQSPILIDLSRSFWRRIVYPKIGFLTLFRKRGINSKIIFGTFYLTLAAFNARMSQVSLDKYTQTNYRSLLVNVPTALADISLFIFLYKIKTRTCRPMNLLVALCFSSLLVWHQFKLQQNTIKIVTIAHAIIIRYLSELCDGLLLIWSIEIFPTVSRAYCVCLIFCGYGIGILGAYLLRENVEIGYLVGLCCAVIALPMEGFMEMNRADIMNDTLEGRYYDQDDQYCKVN